MASLDERILLTVKPRKIIHMNRLNVNCQQPIIIRLLLDSPNKATQNKNPYCL